LIPLDAAGQTGLGTHKSGTDVFGHVDARRASEGSASVIHNTTNEGVVPPEGARGLPPPPSYEAVAGPKRIAMVTSPPQMVETQHNQQKPRAETETRRADTKTRNLKASSDGNEGLKEEVRASEGGKKHESETDLIDFTTEEGQAVLNVLETHVVKRQIPLVIKNANVDPMRVADVTSITKNNALMTLEIDIHDLEVIGLNDLEVSAVVVTGPHSMQIIAVVPLVRASVRASGKVTSMVSIGINPLIRVELTSVIASMEMSLKVVHCNSR